MVPLRSILFPCLCCWAAGQEIVGVSQVGAGDRTLAAFTLDPATGVKAHLVDLSSTDGFMADSVSVVDNLNGIYYTCLTSSLTGGQMFAVDVTKKLVKMSSAPQPAYSGLMYHPHEKSLYGLVSVVHVKVPTATGLRDNREEVSVRNSPTAKTSVYHIKPTTLERTGTPLSSLPQGYAVSETHAQTLDYDRGIIWAIAQNIEKYPPHNVAYGIEIKAGKVMSNATWAIVGASTIVFSLAYDAAAKRLVSMVQNNNKTDPYFYLAHFDPDNARVMGPVSSQGTKLFADNHNMYPTLHTFDITTRTYYCGFTSTDTDSTAPGQLVGISAETGLVTTMKPLPSTAPPIVNLGFVPRNAGMLSLV